MEYNPLSSGVVIIRYINDVPHFLLLRAYQYWDFPKGIVEDGETPFDGALREVEEETTLTDLSFRWGSDYFETDEEVDALALVVRSPVLAVSARR